MATKKRRIRIEDFEIKKEKVRYGRATLTVESWAAVRLTPVARALDKYRQGEATAEQVAWTFIRNQTVKHSPTFDWKQADLCLLLPRVTSVIRMPNMEAQTPEDLIPELEALAESEEQRWQQTQALTSRWSDFVGNSQMKTIVGEVKKMQPSFGKIFAGYATPFSSALSTEIVTVTGNTNYVFNPSLFEGIRSTVEFTNIVSGRVDEVFKDLRDISWVTVAGRFDELAKANHFRHAGEVVEATAETVEKTDSVEELLAGLQPMFASLEKAIKETKDSATRIFLIALAVALIVMMIEASLARLGLPLKPNVPPAQIEPQAKPNVAGQKKPAKGKKTQGKAAGSKKGKATGKK